jgi:hypothetical protein
MDKVLSLEEAMDSFRLPGKVHTHPTRNQRDAAVNRSELTGATVVSNVRSFLEKSGAPQSANLRAYLGVLQVSADNEDPDVLNVLLDALDKLWYRLTDSEMALFDMPD